MTIYELSLAGVDVSGGIKRFGGNAEMYRKYVKRFAADPNYQLLCGAVSEKKAEDAFAAAHALKGIAGNLSMSKLYNDLYPLVEELRSGSLEHADVFMEQIECDYRAVISALEELGD